MKYIRTKDGKIIKESDIPEYYGGLVSSVGLDLDYEESDDIEDLFDEIRVKYENDKIPKKVFFNMVWYYKGIKAGKIKTDIEPFECYGAIWTNWGLKYVAKLNKKGRWSLI